MTDIVDEKPLVVSITHSAKVFALTEHVQFRAYATSRINDSILSLSYKPRSDRAR